MIPGTRVPVEIVDPYLSQVQAQSLAADAGRSFRSLVDVARQRVAHRVAAQDLRNPDEKVRHQVHQIAMEVLRDYQNSMNGLPMETLIGMSMEEAARRIVASIVGLGPLEDLLGLSGIEDIAINGPREVWIFRSGRWEQVPGAAYSSGEELLRVVNLLLAHTGRQLSVTHPIVDGTIRGGHRLNAVGWPCTGEETSPCVCIRVSRGGGITFQDLLQRSVYDNVLPSEHAVVPRYSAVPGALLTGAAARFLHACVLARANIVVVGGTGCGKTTLMNALGSLIPPDRRIVAIEDTPELHFRGSRDVPRNCIYFLTRPEMPDGPPPVTQSDLVRAALRQRPDALTVGEARGAEIIDLMMALFTGHGNGLTSIHADSVEMLPERVMQMLQLARLPGVTREVAAQWIAASFHVVIAMEMAHEVLPDGRSGRVRRIREIAEFVGTVEGDTPLRQALFRYDPQRRELVHYGMPQRRLTGLLQAVGYDPRSEMGK